jgi:hypothetical protein
LIDGVTVGQFLNNLKVFSLLGLLLFVGLNPVEVQSREYFISVIQKTLSPSSELFFLLDEYESEQLKLKRIIRAQRDNLSKEESGITLPLVGNPLHNYDEDLEEQYRKQKDYLEKTVVHKILSKLSEEATPKQIIKLLKQLTSHYEQPKISPPKRYPFDNSGMVFLDGLREIHLKIFDPNLDPKLSIKIFRMKTLLEDAFRTAQYAQKVYAEEKDLPLYMAHQSTQEYLDQAKEHVNEVFKTIFKETKKELDKKQIHPKQKALLEKIKKVLQQTDDLPEMSLETLDGQMTKLLTLAGVIASFQVPKLVPYFYTGLATKSATEGNYIEAALNTLPVASRALGASKNLFLGNGLNSSGSKLVTWGDAFAKGGALGQQVQDAWVGKGFAEGVNRAIDGTLLGAGVGEGWRDLFRFCIANGPAVLVGGKTGSILGAGTRFGRIGGGLIGASMTPAEMALMSGLTYYGENKLGRINKEISFADYLKEAADTSMNSALYSTALMRMGRTPSGRALAVGAEGSDFAISMTPVLSALDDGYLGLATTRFGSALVDLASPCSTFGMALLPKAPKTTTTKTPSQNTLWGKASKLTSHLWQKAKDLFTRSAPPSSKEDEQTTNSANLAADQSFNAANNHTKTFTLDAYLDATNGYLVEKNTPLGKELHSLFQQLWQAAIAVIKDRGAEFDIEEKINLVLLQKSPPSFELINTNFVDASYIASLEHIAADQRASGVIRITTGICERLDMHRDRIAAIIAHEITHALQSPLRLKHRMLAEKQADLISIAILEEAQFNPSALLSALQKMSKDSQGHTSLNKLLDMLEHLLDSHNLTHQRLINLEQELRRLGHKITSLDRDNRIDQNLKRTSKFDTTDEGWANVYTFLTTKVTPGTFFDSSKLPEALLPKLLDITALDPTNEKHHFQTGAIHRLFELFDFLLDHHTKDLDDLLGFSILFQEVFEAFEEVGLFDKYLDLFNAIFFDEDSQLGAYHNLSLADFSLEDRPYDSLSFNQSVLKLAQKHFRLYTSHYLVKHKLIDKVPTLAHFHEILTSYSTECNLFTIIPKDQYSVLSDIAKLNYIDSFDIQVKFYFAHLLRQWLYDFFDQIDSHQPKLSAERIKLFAQLSLKLHIAINHQTITENPFDNLNAFNAAFSKAISQTDKMHFFKIWQTLEASATSKDNLILLAKDLYSTFFPHLLHPFFHELSLLYRHIGSLRSSIASSEDHEDLTVATELMELIPFEGASDTIWLIFEDLRIPLNTLLEILQKQTEMERDDNYRSELEAAIRVTQSLIHLESLITFYLNQNAPIQRDQHPYLFNACFPIRSKSQSTLLLSPFLLNELRATLPSALPSFVAQSFLDAQAEPSHNLKTKEEITPYLKIKARQHDSEDIKEEDNDYLVSSLPIAREQLRIYQAFSQNEQINYPKSSKVWFASNLLDSDADGFQEVDPTSSYLAGGELDQAHYFMMYVGSVLYPLVCPLPSKEAFAQFHPDLKDQFLEALEQNGEVAKSFKIDFKYSQEQKEGLKQLMLIHLRLVLLGKDDSYNSREDIAAMTDALNRAASVNLLIDQLQKAASIDEIVQLVRSKSPSLKELHILLEDLPDSISMLTLSPSISQDLIFRQAFSRIHQTAIARLKEVTDFDQMPFKQKLTILISLTPKEDQASSWLDEMIAKVISEARLHELASFRESDIHQLVQHHMIQPIYKISVVAHYMACLPNTKARAQFAQEVLKYREAYLEAWDLFLGDHPASDPHFPVKIITKGDFEAITSRISKLSRIQEEGKAEAFERFYHGINVVASQMDAENVHAMVWYLNHPQDKPLSPNNLRTIRKRLSALFQTDQQEIAFEEDLLQFYQSMPSNYQEYFIYNLLTSNPTALLEKEVINSFGETPLFSKESSPLIDEAKKILWKNMTFHERAMLLTTLVRSKEYQGTLANNDTIVVSALETMGVVGRKLAQLLKQHGHFLRPSLLNRLNDFRDRNIHSRRIRLITQMTQYYKADFGVDFWNVVESVGNVLGAGSSKTVVDLVYKQGVIQDSQTEAVSKITDPKVKNEALGNLQLLEDSVEEWSSGNGDRDVNKAIILYIVRRLGTAIEKELDLELERQNTARHTENIENRGSRTSTPLTNIDPFCSKNVHTIHFLPNRGNANRIRPTMREADQIIGEILAQLVQDLFVHGDLQNPANILLLSDGRAPALIDLSLSEEVHKPDLWLIFRFFERLSQLKKHLNKVVPIIKEVTDGTLTEQAAVSNIIKLSTKIAPLRDLLLLVDHMIAELPSMERKSSALIFMTVIRSLFEKPDSLNDPMAQLLFAIQRQGVVLKDQYMMIFEVISIMYQFYKVATPSKTHSWINFFEYLAEHLKQTVRAGEFLRFRTTRTSTLIKKAVEKK